MLIKYSTQPVKNTISRTISLALFNFISIHPLLILSINTSQPYKSHTNLPDIQSSRLVLVLFRQNPNIITKLHADWKQRSETLTKSIAVIDALNTLILCYFQLPVVAILYVFIQFGCFYTRKYDHVPTHLKTFARFVIHRYHRLFDLVRTHHRNFAKQALRKFEIAIQPDSILAESVYISETGNLLTITTYPYINGNKRVYFMKTHEAVFEKLKLNFDGGPTEDIMISDGLNSARVVFDIEHTPTKISSGFDILTTGDKAKWEKWLQDYLSIRKNRGQSGEQQSSQRNR